MSEKQKHAAFDDPQAVRAFQERFQHVLEFDVPKDSKGKTPSFKEQLLRGANPSSPTAQ